MKKIFTLSLVFFCFFSDSFEAQCSNDIPKAEAGNTTTRMSVPEAGKGTFMLLKPMVGNMR